MTTTSTAITPSRTTNYTTTTTVTTGTAGAASALPLSQVNLIVLTDVHSWIGGHSRHEPNLNVNYGDVLSFYDGLLQQHMRRSSNVFHQDLFMVMNGDFMDGTGLSTIPPTYLTTLLSEMPFSIVNLGNHELYHDETVKWLQEEFIPHWRGHSLTSNTLLQATGEPLGKRYTLLEGNHSTLLVFGFLYNFKGNCNSTIVENVEDVVQQEWFVSILEQQGSYHAILVMAHMHVTDPLVDVIRMAIRNIVGPNMPIQFITGHTHIRAFAQLDDYATSFEAGRFLDTIGFCSFPTTIDEDNDDGIILKINETSTSSNRKNKPPGFHHVFLDANRQILGDALAATLAHSSGDNSTTSKDKNDDDNLETTTTAITTTSSGTGMLESAAGTLLSKHILETQQELGLNMIVGCSPSHYHLDQKMDRPDSLWGLYMYEIVPVMLGLSTGTTNESKASTEGSNKIAATTTTTTSSSNDSIFVFVQGTGAFRYDLFPGSVVLDDVIAVCPFNDTIYEITTNLTGSEFRQVLNVTSRFPNQVLTNNAKYDKVLPYFAISTRIAVQDDQRYALWTSNFHREDMVRRVEQVVKHSIPDPSPVHDTRHGQQMAQLWTTTNLWQDYIAQYWPCHDVDDNVHDADNNTSHKDGNGTTAAAAAAVVATPKIRQQDRVAMPSKIRHDHRRPNFTVQEERPLTVGFFIILIVGGLYLYQKRKQHLVRSGYVPIGDPTVNLLQSSARSSSSNLITPGYY